MYSRLAQEDPEESNLPSTNRRWSASWGFLAVGLLLLLLFTFPRLPHQDNPGRRPSPALHYLQAMPSTDDPLSLRSAVDMPPLPTRGPKHAGPSTEQGRTNGKHKGTTIAVSDNGLTTISSGSKCVPVDKIGFAKTHKTASSTVQNIFLRWGLNQGWNFALLSSGSHLGPPNNQYVLNKPFQVLLLCVFRFLSCFPPGLLVTRSALG